MPRGDKSTYTPKQKRKARDIEESYENRGISAHESERRAWATVNKDDGGGKRSRSQRLASARKAARTRAAHSSH